MKIVIYIDGAGTGAVHPPSFFPLQLLPALFAELQGHTLTIVSDSTDAPSIPLPAGVSLVSLPVKSGLAAFFRKRFGFPNLARSLKADRILTVNTVCPVKGIRGFVWFDSDDRLLEKTMRKQLAKATGVFVQSPAVLQQLGTAAGFSENLPGTTPAFNENLTAPETVPAFNQNLTAAETVPAFNQNLTAPETVSAFNENLTVPDPAPGSNTTQLIPVTRPARPAFVAMDYPAMDATRLVHTGGRNYFLYTGPVTSALMELFKAFSVFKKRQKSDWKLVLAGVAEGSDPKFTGSLANYRYKDDLILLKDVNTAMLPSLTGAAYAVLFPKDGSASLIPEVLATGVPAIVPDQPAFRGRADGALVFYDPASQVDIAETMMTLYKDETARSARAREGLRVASAASWQELARQVATGLLK